VWVRKGERCVSDIYRESVCVGVRVRLRVRVSVSICSYECVSLSHLMWVRKLSHQYKNVGLEKTVDGSTSSGNRLAQS
jgi:hypothetical protein